MSAKLDPVPFDAFHKSQDIRDFRKIDSILRKIADYEKKKQKKALNEKKRTA